MNERASKRDLLSGVDETFDARTRLASLFLETPADVEAMWLAHFQVPAGDEARRLAPHIRHLIKALGSVFAMGDWTETQLVIDGLVFRKATTDPALDRDLERALSDGREAVLALVGAVDAAAIDAALQQVFEECNTRFSDSYHGLRRRLG
jgi:hypothetical protein